MALPLATREELKQQMFQHLDELCCRLMQQGLSPDEAKSQLEAIAAEALKEIRQTK